MTSLAEIQEAIDKLSPHECNQLRKWLLEHNDGVEETDEPIAAAEEGIRSLEEHGGIPIEEIQRRFATEWGIK
jgi:DNA-binding transcriptional MerR regulator